MAWLYDTTGTIASGKADVVGPIGYAQVSARRRTDIGIAIAAILMLVALLLAAQTEQDHGLQLQTGCQAVSCAVDG